MCPLTPAERRLDDAVGFWSRALDSYFDPEAFRVNLQAAIQAFRSVTFVLQAQKDHLPGFDEWYEPHKDRMRSDPKMRWVVEARNFIEKQGDLTTRSRFLVTLSNSWIDEEAKEYPLSPDVPAADVAKIVANFVPPAKINEEALLRFERRWVDSLLPEEEVLSTLIHCYLVLRKLLRAAHDLLGTPRPEVCPFEERVDTTNEVLPEPMYQAEFPRTAWFNLRQDKLTEYELKTTTITRGDEQKAAERYPDLRNANVSLMEAKSFRELCVGWFQNAHVILERDGYHLPIALIDADGVPLIHQLKMENRADKHVMMRQLAAHCAKVAATWCIFISEAWIAKPDPRYGPHAVNYPHRGEALVLHGVHQDGTAVTCQAVFTRVREKIVLGPDNVTQGTTPPAMQAIAQAIRMRRQIQ